MRFLALLPLLFVGACAAARPPSDSTRIENVTLLDGRGGPPIAHAWIELRAR